MLHIKNGELSCAMTKIAWATCGLEGQELGPNLQSIVPRSDTDIQEKTRYSCPRYTNETR